MKYALPYDYCRQLGQNYAVAGRTEAELVRALRADGFRPEGLTIRRAVRAHRKQAEAR